MPGQNDHYLLEACKKNDMAEVNRIFKQATITKVPQDKEGNSPLHWAVIHNNPLMLGKLLDRLPPDARTLTRKDEYKAIVLAAAKGYWGCVVKFAEKPFIEGAGYEIALLYAVRANQLGVVERLLKKLHGEQCDARSERMQRTSLHYAVLNHHHVMLQALLEAGANQSIKDGNKENPLKLALQLATEVDSIDSSVKPYYWACINVLASYAIDSNQALYNEVLLAAARANQYHTVRVLLLTKKVDPNVLDDEGKTPLHHATLNDNPEMAALLVHHGANIDARTRDEDTAIELAIRNDYKNTVLWLLKLKADRVSSEEMVRVTQKATNYASELYNDDIMALVPNCDARPSQLQTLIAMSDMDGLSALRETQLRLDTPFNNGLYPLTYAVQLNLPEVVQFLCGKLPKDSIRRKEALGVAIQSKNWVLAKLIHPESALAAYLDDKYSKRLSFFSLHNTETKHAFLNEARKRLEEVEDKKTFYELMAGSHTAKYRQCNLWKMWKKVDTNTVTACKEAVRTYSASS